MVSPALVHPEAVEAVVEVVGGGDGGEHVLDAGALVGDGVGVLQEGIIPLRGGRGGGCRRRIGHRRGL